MKRQGRSSVSQKSGSSREITRKLDTSTDPVLRPVCRWSRQQLVYWLESAGLQCFLPLMDEEAENEPISPEVSMFAKHQSAPNLLRLAWLPPSKIASFIGMPADDDLRKIFIYEDFIRDLAVVQSMLITPQEILNSLQERIHKPSPLIPRLIEDAGDPNYTRNMEGIAIIDYLKLWISFDGFHEMANDQILFRTFNTFCDLHISPINPSDAKLLKADAKARIKQKTRKEKDKDKKQYYTTAAPKPRDLPKSKHFTLMDIHPEELARQLTLMEEEIFIQIRPREFLKQAWNKNNHETNAPNVTRLTRNFNKLINWITTEVLKSSDASLRAETIARFIKTAKYLEKLRNYNGVMQVLSSLHSSAVSRLKQSWALITPKVKGHFDRLTALMSNLGNFKVFRETYAALESEEPCIPFIAVFLTDCTYLDDTMNDKDDTGRYNWDKLSTMSNKIREIRRFDMRRYDLVPVASIQQYINSAESWNDNKTLYAISQLAEDGSSSAASGHADSSVPKKTDARKAYSKFNRVTVANMNLRSMYLHQDTSGEQNVLSQRDWKILLTGASLKNYKDGDVVLDIGTTNDRLFRIKSGMVKVHKQSIDTPPVATMGKEEMFGEISMLLRGEDGTTTAAIVASGAVEIWEISIDFVLRMCEGDHLLSEKLHRIIAVKLASRLKSLNTVKRPRGAARQASRLIDRRSIAPLATTPSPVPSPVKERSDTPTNSSDDSIAPQESPTSRNEDKPPSGKIKILKTALGSSTNSLSLKSSDESTATPEGIKTEESVPAPTFIKRDSETPKSKRRSHHSQLSSDLESMSNEALTDIDSPPLARPVHPSSSPSASPLRSNTESRLTRQFRSPSPKVTRIQEEVESDVASPSKDCTALPLDKSTKSASETTETTTVKSNRSSSEFVVESSSTRTGSSNLRSSNDMISDSESQSGKSARTEGASSPKIRTHLKKSSLDTKASKNEHNDTPSTVDVKSEGKSEAKHDARHSEMKSPERARVAPSSPESRKLKRASAQHSKDTISDSLEAQKDKEKEKELAKEISRSASPGKSLSSWRGRVSAALLPRRSSSDSKDKEKDKEKERDSPAKKPKSSSVSTPTAEIPEAERQDVLFRKRFKLKENVILIRTFECALKGTVVSHGTLYISEKYWCFGSRMFGLKTSETIKVELITDVEMSRGKYLIIKHGSKSLKLLGFENLEDTHSLLRSLFEKFTKPASSETNASTNSIGGTLTRRTSSRFINRSAILFDAAASAASSSSLSAATGAQFASASTEQPSDLNGLDEEDEDDISSKFELTPQDWQKILKGANLVAYQKGDYVIREGDQFQRVFQLLRGSACIQKEIDGEMKTLGRLQPEDGIFGEISFLEGGCATASIVADEPDTAIYIIEGYFLNVYFERNAGVGGRFYHFLAQLLSKRIKAREAAQAQASAAAAQAGSLASSTSSLSSSQASLAPSPGPPGARHTDASVLMNQGDETSSAPVASSSAADVSERKLTRNTSNSSTEGASLRTESNLTRNTSSSSSLAIAESSASPSAILSSTPPSTSPLEGQMGHKKTSSSPQVERQPPASPRSEQPVSSPRGKNGPTSTRSSGERSPRFATGVTIMPSTSASELAAALAAQTESDRSNSNSAASSPRTPNKDRVLGGGGSSPRLFSAPPAESSPIRSPRSHTESTQNTHRHIHLDAVHQLSTSTLSKSHGSISPSQRSEKSPRAPRSVRVADASPRDHTIAEESISVPGPALITMSGEPSTVTPSTTITIQPPSSSSAKKSKSKQRSRSDVAPATAQISTNSLKANNSMSTIPES